MQCSIASILKISFVVIVAMVTISDARSTRKDKGKREVQLRLSNEEFLVLDSKTSVEQFANQGLCRHLNGQRYFQKAMVARMPDLKEDLLNLFVSQLCAEKGIMLEMWVGEIFDTDGDGNLNHFEMHHYESD